MLDKKGEIIRKLRLSKGLTQQELADRAGISRSLVRGIEQGKRTNFTVDTLNSLAGALGITPTQLSGHIYGDIASVKEEHNIYDFPEANRLPSPALIPVYTDFPFHAGAPTRPVEFIHRTSIKASQKNIEGYIVHGNCLDPVVQDNDIIIVDRQGQIDNGDIVACLIGDELHIARLRRVAEELWLENNNGKYRFQECLVAAPVIEVIRRLK